MQSLPSPLQLLASRPLLLPLERLLLAAKLAVLVLERRLLALERLVQCRGLLPRGE